jgi:hypothetical protein
MNTNALKFATFELPFFYIRHACIINSEISKKYIVTYFHIFTSKDVDYVIISRQKNCFQNGDISVRAANQLLSLLRLCSCHIFVPTCNILHNHRQHVKLKSQILANFTFLLHKH